MQSRELTQCADCRLSGAPNAEGARMPVLLRRATEADARHVESLLAELGYPSKEADVRHRLCNSLRSDTSCFLLAQSASEVVGLVCAELVPYFPNGSTICRITGLVVSAQHRGRGVGEKASCRSGRFRTRTSL